MNWAKSLGRLVLGDYQLYRIYRFTPSRGCGAGCGEDVRRISNVAELLKSPYPEIQALHVYGGDDAFGYGCWSDNELVSVCWYWTGERYRSQRNFWKLEHKDAKLVQISTASVARGKGLAKTLLLRSAEDMAMLGYENLYARIWHSNRASIRLFHACGWRYIAFVSEAYPLNTKYRLRFVRNR